MRILISNDDGINADGINALAEAFSDHEIVMVAPESERSASSHSLHSMYNITYKKIDKYPFDAYACSGTPADCIKLAVLHLYKDKPFDLILSGVNLGTNLGSDVMYSGTVSVAFEAIYLGIKAIAISASSKYSYEDYFKVAKFVKDNIDKLLALDIPISSALSINYPLHTAIKGAKIAPLGIHIYGDSFKQMENGYKLHGLPIIEHKDDDIYWFNEGYVTISPIQNDRNDYKTLNRIKGDFK